MRNLPEITKQQLVLDQMEKDPNQHQGPAIIQDGIAFDRGIHLPR
jgi:hypothetical protein